MNRARTSIEDWHHKIWPGVPVDLLQPKNRGGKRKANQKTWLGCATVPTSYVISYMAFLVGPPKRSRLDRTNAALAMKFFFVKLFSSKRCTFLHKKFGTDEWVSISITADGQVLTDDLWARDFYQTHIQSAWKMDLSNVEKGWITTRMDNQVSFLAVLVFLLDHQKRGGERPLPEFQARALSLLSQMAFSFNELAQTCKVKALPDTLTRKRSVQLSLDIKRQIAHMCWNGEDTYTRFQQIF